MYFLLKFIFKCDGKLAVDKTIKGLHYACEVGNTTKWRQLLAQHSTYTLEFKFIKG